MTALTPATQHTRQLLVIDQNVDGWRDLVNNAGIGVSVLLLDPSQNGLTQIANAITAYSNLDAIHILSHGSVASLQLGSVTLNSENLNQYTQQLTTIGNALNENGDLLLYGCNVAQGETGKQFIQALAQITGADVAASDDLTGNTALGGDWVLEASTGTIEADIAVSSDTQQNYNHVLGKPSDYVFAQMSNLAYSDNPSFAGWVVQTYTYVLSLGFFAVEFLKGNDIVIAFRGTNFDSSGVWDIGADTAIANPSPDWSSQFDYAIQTANIIREASPNAHIYVTGHSLGGALAQVVSQMFGFEGATFEPGGAQNIVDSSQFSIEASAIGITPVGVPTGFINYTVDGSLISSESGAHVGNTVTLENTYVINFFLSNLTGNPLIDIRVTAREQKALHSIDGIVTLMQARAVADVASVLQPSVDSWIAGAATGDLGVSEQPIGQGALDYYGTDGNNYLYANNNDNIIYGYAGNDIIYSFAGNDTVYGGEGDDTISTAQGNDVIDTGGGNDTVYAGSGDDTISVLVNYGATNTVSGGTGIDGLNIDFSANPYTRLYWYGIDTSGSYSSQINSDSSITAIQAVLDNTVKFYVGYSPNFNQNYSSSYNLGVTFDGIENLSLIASDTGLDDLLIVQGNGNYDGKGGTDTLYADWSKSTANIIWNNAPTQTQTVNGITVSGLERLLLMTGSGDDTLSNLNTATDDTFDSGAGNDIIQSGAGNDTLHGGSGTDVLQGGDGNDVYLFNIGDGHDQIIDTAGTDRLVFGANITASQIGVSRVGNEIRLAISADDSIRFTENAIGSYAIERIEFQNGTVWTATQIQQNINSTVNHTPALSHPLIDQIIKQQSNNPNAIFSYAIPANSFTDIDGDALTYRASLADGSALPNWLGFDANTRTFTASTAIVNAGSFDIKVTATDSLGASVSDDFKLLVEANHNPTGTPSAVLMAGAEDTPYIVSMADLLAGFSDVDGDSLTVSSLSSSGDLTANFSGWTLNNNGTFIVPILPNYNGMLYLDYDVEDGRGGSIHAVQSVNLVSVNDAPSGTDKTITFNENSTYTFTATDFGFSDVDGNSLLAVNISSLPLAGGLKLNGVAVIGNASISVADINNGQFTFTPAASTSGNNYASFNFQVQDDGGTANGGLDLDGSANTLSFNVVAIAPMTIVGSAGSDVLIGGAANDILNGGIGADVMKGGAGNDIYYVDNAGDSVVEGNAEGVDTVYSTLVYSLADNVENLVLMENAVGISGSPVGAYGNALNNQLTGNSADNFFIGGAGNDTLDGGVSDVYNPGVVDILVGGAGDDTFVARGFYGAGNYAGGDGSDWLDFSQPDAYTAGRRNTERAGVKVDLMVGTAATYYFNAINFTWTDASGQIALASIENIRGTAQGDSLNGNGDANVIDGGAGSDVINGGAGDDILDAGVSDIYNLGVIDLLNGGTGNDIFLSRGFYGAGKYMGGDGLDWLDFSQSDTYTDGRRNAEGAGIKVDLTAGVAFTYYQAVKNFTWVDANGKIALATIENIRGTDQGDSLSGDINANVLEGGAGNDVLNSGAGDDVLNGGIGNDVLNGGAGADDMRGGVGNDTLDGGASDVYNPSVIDTLNGDAGNDTFLVRGFYGAGNYNGGADTDLLDFSQSDTYTAGRRNAERAGVKVDLMVGTAATYYLKATNFTWTDANGQIAIASIENIRGTAQGDSLNGNGDANVIDGGAGSDVINGGAGDDILDAGVSDIYNLGVIDTLNGGAGDDSFLSRGFYGAGIYDGGTGNDTLDFSQADAYTAARRSAENAGVSVDLSTGKASTYYLSATNFTWTDANGQIAVIHIENVTGTAQGDKLIGDANANVFEGGNGSDILAGGAGKDLYLLQESVAATDTLKIATGDSLIDNYDIANSFGLGTGTANTIAVDKLDLSFTSIAANVSHVNGTDFGNVGSHSISNGLISFANVIGDTPLSITAANLTDAINYVQAAITGNNTVAFISDGNTFVFQDGGVTDTLVELVGVMANSVNNSGLGVGAVWIA